MGTAFLTQSKSGRSVLAGEADVNHQANDGTTALIVAAWNGNKEVAYLLLAAGADRTIRVSQKGGPFHKGLEPGNTALSVARRRGHDEIVALLEDVEKRGINERVTN